MVTNVSTTNTVNTNVGAHETMAHAGQTGGGNWLQQAGSWLGSDSMSQGMGGMGGMSNGEMILAADQTGGQIFGMLAGQNETTAGNIIKSIPGLSTVGNLVNAAFGSHINEGFVKQTEFGINSTGSQAFNSNTNADVLNDWKNLVQLSHVNKSDVGSDGWFSKKAKRKTNALNEAIDEANALQLTNFGHAVTNADQNTDLRIAQGMIAAYGGPINSFRKYYNDGGNLFNTPQFFTFEPQIHDDGGYLSKAKALIRQNEGWRAKPYKDAPKGKAWRSVGYGFNDSGFREKYPEGISKHYEHGITKEQAEQELEYYLRKSEKTLKNIYGKQWNSFTDNQKAAILDTYYQSPASVGKKSRFYKAVTAGEDAGKYLGVAGYSKRNNVRQGVFGGGAVPKSSRASYSSGYSNVDMASSSGAGQIDTEELSYPSPILEGRSPVVDFDLSGIEPTKVIDPKINLSRPVMDLNFMSAPIAQAPQVQAPTIGTVEDFLASYGDIDTPTIDASENNLFNDGGSTNGWLDFFKSWNQSQGGNNYFNMNNSWKPSDGLQRNTSNGSVQDWIGVAQTVGNTIAHWGEEDPSLGRGGGYSMFGMAAYDLLKGIRDATKSKRESIDQKLGIPIYACGGRLYPDGGALGGMGAGGGESVGAMGYAQAGTAALKLASNAVHQAKLTVDEDKIDRSINRYGYGFDEYAKNVNTNGDLLDLWQNNATVNPNLTARDFRDKSEFDDFLNSYAASWEGFNAGQNWGPWGAAIGAVVGGISSRIGSQIGKNKAKHAAEEANEGIKNANERRQATLEYLAERVDQENDLRILQDMDKRNINSGASGGDLNMGFGLRNPFIMPDGVANPLYRSFGGGLTHGVNWDTGVNWVDEGGSHGENPLGGVPMGVDDQGTPNLVEEGEAIWNGDYVFSKRMKVPKKLAKKYGLGGDITFADAIKKLTKDSEERPLSMIDRDTNDHILGEFADVQEERRMAKAQRAMEREQQLQEDFMTGFQYGLGGHLSPFGIVPNSDNISPFEKAEQQFEDGGGIHIDPSKRGTFKAQASKMGMGVQEAASHILANKENYSPAMVKKAVFAHNFAHADGGDLFTNPFAYGGEMGNIFAGPGNRPNAHRVSTQSPIRRMFGDTVGSFVENVTDAVNDPIGYFAGDEIDAAMERVSKMSKPQLEKFFRTNLGQRVAQYIVDSESNSGSRNYQQASVRGGRAIARAGQRAARPLVRETVAMAKRAVAQSKAAARSQGKAPAASRASQASRASAPTPTTAQQAYRQAANRDWQRGQQWAENARNARPTQGTTYESYAGSVPNRYPRTYSSSNPYAQLAGTLEFGSTTPWGTIGAVGGGAATLGTAAAIAAASDNARGAANTRRAAAPARTNTGLSAQLDARLDAMDNAPWMDMSAITGPSYLTPAELQAMGQQQAAQAAAAQAASNRRRGNGAASVPTTRGSVGNVARAATSPIGETGLHLYDWYRNGDDGTGTHWGFTVGENGLIDKETGYTDEYRNLVATLGAKDIKDWAKSHPNDPSLQSFLDRNYKGANMKEKLDAFINDSNFKDETWRKGATDGKYGFMHHVAAQIGANPADVPTEAELQKVLGNAPAAKVGDVELPQQELLAVDPRIAEDPARIAKGTRTTTVDENGTKVTRITDPDAAKNNNTGNGKFKPRDTWMRQVPIWMSGLAALRGELTPPDYTNADAILSAAYAAGRPVSVGTEYVGDYRRRDPFDERYLMNIINQNAAATRENLMNFSGGNRAVAMSGMSNNDLTRQMALAEAARQAYLANRADDAQVSDFNYRTNKGNADAQNTRNLALAQLNSGRQNAMLSGVAQGARLRQAIKDQRDAAISANWTAFAQNMGDWGKENGYYNMLGGLNEEGVLKYFFGDDWKTKFNNNSMG